MQLDPKEVEEVAKTLYIRSLKMLPPDIKRGFERLMANETDATGHAEDFSPVRFESPAPVGAIVAAKIVGSDGRHLIARKVP